MNDRYASFFSNILKKICFYSYFAHFYTLICIMNKKTSINKYARLKTILYSYSSVAGGVNVLAPSS
jgi:hypothetical protein